jgi:hypothetical protein
MLLICIKVKEFVPLSNSKQVHQAFKYRIVFVNYGIAQSRRNAERPGRS